MANWQHKLNLMDIWDNYHLGIMTIQELAKEVSVRLNKLQLIRVPEEIIDQKEEIADYFLGISEDETVTVEEFDAVMGELYDWGDIQLDNNWPPKKVCWIATN